MEIDLEFHAGDFILIEMESLYRLQPWNTEKDYALNPYAMHQLENLLFVESYLLNSVRSQKWNIYLFKWFDAIGLCL